jgi:hypothetical protein
MKKALTTIMFSTIILTGSLASAQVNSGTGLRLETNETVTKFHRHLTEFTGGCPGKSWSGTAMSGGIRFISAMTNPVKGLMVEFNSLTTGKTFMKKYQEEEEGSSKLSLRRLGRIDGRHEIKYKIFNKETEHILEQGSFSYSVTSSMSKYKRSPELRMEKYCVDDPHNKDLNKCKDVNWRLASYCNGIKASPH